MLCCYKQYYSYVDLGPQSYVDFNFCNLLQHWSDNCTSVIDYHVIMLSKLKDLIYPEKIKKNH